jgi:molecular chaperone GrpE
MEKEDLKNDEQLDVDMQQSNKSSENLETESKKSSIEELFDQEKILQEKIEQERIRQEEIRQEEIKQEEIKQEEIKKEESRQEQARQEEARQEQARQAKENQENNTEQYENTTDKSSEPHELSKDEIIGTLQHEVEEWKNSYLRKQADFQNFTKRKEKELEELRAFASEKIVTKLLDGVDNLDRAIASSESTKDFDALLKGVDMILTQLKGIMQAEGVKPIEVEGKYDPVYHYAVMVEDNPDFENDTIITELQKGYTMKGKVIRPTMVKVCKRG